MNEKLNNDQSFEQSQNDRYFCKCCGYDTLIQFPNGLTYEICEICYWEDDLYQNQNPSVESGPNQVSLIQARKNFEDFGSCELNMLKYCRKPNQNDCRKIKAL